MARTSERLYIARSGSSATNTTAVALAAATVKTVAGVFGTAATTVSLVRFAVTFDGVTGSAVPALVEVGVTTAAGTATAFTPLQVTGMAMASPCSAGYNYTVEPTYSRILFSEYVPVFMGSKVEWIPLGEELACAVSQGLAIRVTAPAVVNCIPSILYSE